MNITAPWDLFALLIAGAILGAWGFGCWCGCLCHLRWRRHWRKLADRNAREFYEVPANHTARFIAQTVAKRNAERAAMLREAGR